MRFLKLVLIVLVMGGLILGCGKKGAEKDKAAAGEAGQMDSKSVDAVFVKKKADTNARLAGRMAKMAEEMYYSANMRYTSDLGELLKFSPGITEDAGVTFIWGVANDQTFTFTTTHKDGSRTFVFHE